MPDQYRNVPHTIEAHQYDGTNHALDTLTAWGARAYRDPDGVAVLNHDSGYDVLDPQDWVIRTVDGYYVCPDDEFQQEYVQRTPEDRDELRFKMHLNSGSQVEVSITGLADGRDGVYTLMQLARPETILAYIKEQTAAGDLSMLGLVDELAALANPGE